MSSLKIVATLLSVCDFLRFAGAGDGSSAKFSGAEGGGSGAAKTLAIAFAGGVFLFMIF